MNWRTVGVNVGANAARLMSVLVVVLFGLVMARACINSRYNFDYPRTEAPPVSIAGTRYLAIGDSFSAGEGVEPYEHGSGDLQDGGDNCHRSERAYARLLRFTTPVEVDFRACSGARIRHLMEEAQQTGPVGTSARNRWGVQLGPGALGPDVGLITVTIGGNDAEFANVLKHCFTRPFCQSRQFLEGRSLREWSAVRLPLIGEGLKEVYRHLRSGAPNARIIVLGYPHLFPGSTNTQYADCWAALSAGVPPAEQQALRDLTDRLNEVIFDATRASGVEYIETTQIFFGHEPCGTLGSWIKLANVGKLTRGEIPARASFHPTAHGQAAFARTIACYLDQYPESPTGPVVTLPDGTRLQIGPEPRPGSFLEPIPCARGGV